MNKITFSELDSIFREHNEGITTKGTDPNPLYAVIVYTEDSFYKPFTETERSYRISSDNKYFIAGQIGNSIFGDCLDGKDMGVRLDWYRGDWKIDYCYLEQEV